MLVLAAAFYILRLNLWRALLYLFPSSVRVEEDAPADAKLKLPNAILGPAEQLQKLGLEFIGAHIEQPRLRPPVTCFDYASPDSHTFASLFVGEEGQARAELLTPLEGGFVRTANYRRSALEAAHYFSGYLENIPLDRLLHAHQRRVAAMGPPKTGWNVGARVEAARAWYASHGARLELHQQHQQGLVWTFGAFVIAGVAVVTLVNA